MRNSVWRTVPSLQRMGNPPAQDSPDSTRAKRSSTWDLCRGSIRRSAAYRPSASAELYPKRRSASGLHRVMRPSSSSTAAATPSRSSRPLGSETAPSWSGPTGPVPALYRFTPTLLRPPPGREVPNSRALPSSSRARHTAHRADTDLHGRDRPSKRTTTAHRGKTSRAPEGGSTACVARHPRESRPPHLPGPGSRRTRSPGRGQGGGETNCVRPRQEPRMRPLALITDQMCWARSSAGRLPSTVKSQSARTGSTYRSWAARRWSR